MRMRKSCSPPMRYSNVPPTITSSLTTSLPMKVLLVLSIAYSARYRASAFVPPSSSSSLSSRRSTTTSSSVSLLTSISPNRMAICNLAKCSTELRATNDDDDDEVGNGNSIHSSKQTPKTTSKGTEKSEQSTARPSSTSKSKSKSKTTIRKIKGTAQTKQKKKKKSLKKTTKRPIEISTKSPTNNTPMGVNENENDDEDNYAYNIPTNGYSLADTLENKSPENQERFETTLTPIVVGIVRNKEDGKVEEELEFTYDEDGFPVSFQEVKKEDDEDAEEENEGKEGGKGRVHQKHEGVARIDTISTMGDVGEEPVRWLVSLGEPSEGGESFAMIDLPPYSDKLANEIRTFMDPLYNSTESNSGSSSNNDGGAKKATLDAILITNQQCIHYDTTPAVYVTRKSDLTKWKKAFPTAEVVMYRLDVPRECREEVTQVLDGYGPWGWEEEKGGSGDDEQCGGSGAKFVETGRPLTIEEWDEDTKSKVLTEGAMPPEDQVVEGDDDDDADAADPSSDDGDNDDDAMYSPQAIREREEKHRLLAVYTPGHTFGSVTYIFPRRGICCSGYTLPLESSGTSLTTDDDDDYGGGGNNVVVGRAIPPQGPRLDYQGYLATSASRPRQMSSALSLINRYIDRFRVVCPARGDMVFLNDEEGTRKRELMESVGLYQKIGEIYGRLGIVEK